VVDGKRSLFWLKIAVAVLLIGALIILQQLGALDMFADPRRLKQALIGLGSWGHVAFVASYTLLQPFGIPGTVFIMAAPLVWPWPVAFALSMTGTMTASLVGFWFARFVARDWVADKIPPRIRKYEDALEARAFLTVFILRFVFWMPQWLHVFFGVSKVSFWAHFWGSLAGYAIPIFLVSYFGEQLFAMLSAVSIDTWIWIGVGTVCAALVAWVVARRTRLNRLRMQNR
jgi:uncharacterized membrane protein YdjX (TVP38/TMEM64 family)